MNGKSRRNVTITEQAFVGMVASAIEVYKKESFGLLIGKVHKKHYYITDTYTYQSAKRSYDSVSVSRIKEKKLNHALRFFTTTKVIGDFHTHPGGPHYLSLYDEKELLGGDTSLSILISIFKMKKHQKWARHKDFSVSGTIGNEYFVKISAFEAEKKTKRVFPIKIVCPYLKKVNANKLFACKVC